MMSHLRGSAFVSLVRIAGVLLQALAFVYLANLMPPAEVGRFAAIYTLWTVVRYLGPLGFDQLAMRDIAMARVKGNVMDAQALCNFSFLVTLPLSVAIAFVVFAGLTVLSAAHMYQYPAMGMVAAAVALPAYALIGLLSGQLRGFGRNVSVQALESVGIPGAFVLLLFLGAHLKVSGLGWALVAQAIGTIAVTVAYCALRWRAGLALTAQLSRDRRWAAIKHATHMWLALAINTVALRVPTYICLVLLGPAQVALWEVANRFGTLPTLFTFGAAVTYSPVMAAAHSQGDHKTFQRALASGSWFAFLPTIGVLAALAAIGPILLARLFPLAYAAAYVPLLLICAAMAINAGFGLSGNAFLMSGHQRLVSAYSALQLAVVVLIGTFLTKLLGINGLAVSLVVAAIARDVGLALRLKGKLTLKPGLLCVMGRHTADSQIHRPASGDRADKATTFRQEQAR